MARVHYVASSRTAHTCRKGHVIEPPEGYAWAAPGYHAPKRFACAAHPFRPSELTASAVSEVYAARESAEDQLDALGDDATAEDLESILEEVKTAAEELRDAREEALSAWENGNGPLEEARDQAEEATSTLDGHQVEAYGGDDGPEQHEGDGWEPSDEYAEWLAEQVDALRTAIDEAVDAL